MIRMAMQMAILQYRRLQKALQASGGMNDCCARFGGDEFIVAGPENDNDTGELLIEKVHRYLDEFNASSGKPYQVDASIGLVSLYRIDQFR